ncbi:hypothetical protein [Acidocella sp.]|uniref:hypothetical protein n=1 Tax=Acidocella sp. TaxID=50710 RepID=UPI003D0517B0
MNISVLCDYGSGDKSKVERLRQSQILKSGRILTATDFTGKTESDIEDLFDPTFYCALVNQALGLHDGAEITVEKAESAGNGSPRIVKQVEALCRTLPADIPEFNHYLPAEWLLRHPELLDAQEPMVDESLNRFEAVFKELNRFLG